MPCMVLFIYLFCTSSNLPLRSAQGAACVHPGAAIRVSATPLYKHVGRDRGTETITGYLLCLLLLYLLPCPWFCSIVLLSMRVKIQYFPVFCLHWLQGHPARATGKGMAFLNYILANQRFSFSSLWTSLRTQKKEKKGNISISLLRCSLLINTVKQDCRPDPLLCLWINFCGAKLIHGIIIFAATARMTEAPADPKWDRSQLC